MKIDDSLI